MTICERMFDVIEKTDGKSAAGLCKVLGVGTGLTSGWKTRNTDPPAKYIVPICEYLGITIIYLLTGEEQDIDIANSIQSDESRLLSKYRLLDDDGKDAVRGVLIQEQRRVESNRGSGSSAVS